MSPRGRLLTFVAFAVPFGSIGEPKVFLLVLAPLLVLALLWLGWREGRMLPDFPWGSAWLAVLILLWAGASAAWSLDPGATWKKLGDLVLAAGAGLLMLGADRRLTLRDGRAVGIALALGVVIALAAQWSERATGGALVRVLHDTSNGSLSPLVRGISVSAILGWAALIFLYRAGHWRLGIALGIAGIATFWMSEGTSAALSATIGAVMFLVFFGLPRRAVAGLAILAAVWVLAAPIAMKGALAVVDTGDLPGSPTMLSALHRLTIWRFTSEKILERPILGYGLRAGRDVPGGKGTFTLPQDPAHTARPIFSMHPHNGPLEWWLELGFPGAVLGAIAVFLLFRWPARVRDRGTRALLVGQSTTAFGILNLSFGVWQVWWLAALVFAAFLTVTVLESADRADLPARAGMPRGGDPPAP